jgi:hypothetical protein
MPERIAYPFGRRLLLKAGAREISVVEKRFATIRAKGPGKRSSGKLLR